MLGRELQPGNGDHEHLLLVELQANVELHDARQRIDQGQAQARMRAALLSPPPPPTWPSMRRQKFLDRRVLAQQ